ncbi:hypothetical protein ABES03_08790 [Neobacillus rhizosphaerae]|uniref:hypothetical protein n=1 Tax=Neobacillus rhizosphaerae TaxID=2880965 RepID=UPI003D27EE6C
MSQKVIEGLDNVVVGKNECLFCENDIQYVAIVRGENDLEELKKQYPFCEFTDQVLPLNKKVVNNVLNKETQQIVDLEVIVRCPKCNANNRFTSYLKLRKWVKE